ncbi:lrr receptor-like serine/threonine-protein kinase ios1 [Quercus suber]|uniref:Lrr receptor-like serine/threonine-protein kinase ios1 n=1 Tax=Quercus suber TaxID=58331 RepID=A0AAW0KIF8_QUESU
MDYTLELIFVLKAWRVVVLVIGILGNWKLAEGDNEHAGRKLVDHVPGFISIDCGATKDYADEGTGIFYRYKNDVYDRFWYTSNPLSNSVPINTSSVIDIQNNNDSYQIPSEVLRTAVQPSSGYHSLSFSDMSGYTQESYVCFHFAEIAKLTQGKKREFIINVKEGSYISEPVTLDYLKPLSICLNQTFEWPFSFVIKATTASDLPPILNAFEVYGVIPQYELHKPTNSRDVAAIMDIKQTLRIFREDWLADPCVPIELTWSGLTCNSSDDTPMIISLNLSSSKLTGEIPFSLSNLTALQYLDLSYNELTGSVPKFLAQLPNLKTLNLSGNQLNGLIPEDLIQKSRDGSLVFGAQKINSKRTKTTIDVPTSATISSLFGFFFSFVHGTERQRSGFLPKLAYSKHAMGKRYGSSGKFQYNKAYCVVY